MTKKDLARLIGLAMDRWASLRRDRHFTQADQLKHKINLLKKKLHGNA